MAPNGPRTWFQRLAPTLSLIPKLMKWPAADKKALVEASGNITRGRLNDLAQTGVDLISIGALTHSAAALDLSMLTKCTS